MSAHVEAHDARDHPAQHTFHPHPTGLHPVTLGLIIFLVSEVALFGAFFLFYGHARLVNHLQWPAPGYEIPADSTSINTAILVASSFTCEFALLAMLRKSRSGLFWWLVVTFVMGATFLGLQVHEYLTIGFLPNTNAMGTAFFTLTGLHGAHVTLGLMLLMFCIIRSARGFFSPDDYTGLLVASIYWHFVDVIWILLYTLVYLLPDHVT